MNNTTTRSAFARRSLIAAGAFASVAALAIAAAPAYADTPTVLDAGHVDVVHVALSDDLGSLVLGTNDEAGESSGVTGPAYYPGTAVDAGDVIYSVTQAGTTPGTCVIPQSELAATGLWGGFAAAGTEDPDPEAIGLYALDIDPSDTVTVSFDTVTGSDVTINFGGQSGVTPGTALTGSGSFTFALDEDDEAYHLHPTWTFPGDGSYVIEFSATTTINDGGAVAGSGTVAYHFDVDCGA